MRRTVLDSAAKEALRKAVRGLRESLLEALDQAAEGEYRLQTSLERAQLPVERRVRRERLEAWLEEQVRATPAQERKGKGAEKALRERFRSEAVKEAAYTLLNRLVFVRIMEHHGLIKPALVSGGWDSAAYRDEFVHYSHALQGDDTRGYAALLELLYAELALDLPGLFGPVGLTQLFPVPAASLREVIAALNEKALDRAWGDDMTLGWVYQFWNDPDREALDLKVKNGGKIEAHEIASKTQMFTERYMVEWLLHNSLGQTWLAICAKNGWTADFQRVRGRLDARRVMWRERREAGEVALDALMPLEGELEEHWKYWVPQALPEDAVASAPASIRELKLLDPACGSGHFLVVAFDLLAALHEEEARHRGESCSSEEIARSIVENNLHGVDIDPRAVQLAAAGLWLKGRLFAPAAELRAMNLVAPMFRLAGLPKNDPAFERLCAALEAFPAPRQRKLELIEKLARVDYMGTLLPVDAELQKFLEQARGALRAGDKVKAADGQKALRRWFAEFLDAHATRAELGLRLDGEQVAAGVRFLEIVQDGAYDIVVGNPPYHSMGKLANSEDFVSIAEEARADIFAAFFIRGMALLRPTGHLGLVTLSNWMYLSAFEKLRRKLADEGIRLIADFGKGAFSSGSQLISTSACLVSPGHRGESVALRLHDGTGGGGVEALGSIRAGLLAQVGRYQFEVAKLSDINGMPLVYWWEKGFLDRYLAAPKLGQLAPAKVGLQTSDNTRFLRKAWEIPPLAFGGEWPAYVKGAAGRIWFEPTDDVVNWSCAGLEIRTYERNGRIASRPQNMDQYFKPGIAFTKIGQQFSARYFEHPSIFDVAGSSVFPPEPERVLCLLNSTVARQVLEAFNPTVNFQVGDVERLAVLTDDLAPNIFSTLKAAFNVHESHRECSRNFEVPGASPWRCAQDWAQHAVDREEGAALQPYDPEYDPSDPVAMVSFAIGVALGRFGDNGEGILAKAPANALPAGILYLNGSETFPDSLSHPAACGIVTAWANHGQAVLAGDRRDLREWLRDKFFVYHKTLYENRPIYFPLSSDKKTFVAFISIHRWTDGTLQTLLAEYLKPNLRQLEAAITEFTQARASSDRKAASGADRQCIHLKRLRDELTDFIAVVTECAERGAPFTGPGCPPREIGATHHMDLDDGVMINSAALWPLLESQWKDPRKWWKELCEAKGRKDYDWAHLSARYFPKRVDDKCRVDPSLAVAHGCFWKYHPATAYAWELRLAQEIGPDFAIDEQDAAEHRARFLIERAEQAVEILKKEQDRRERLRHRAADTEAEPGHPGLARTNPGELPENDVVECENEDDEQVAV
jgi:hypothetical protein